jgi:hypothetical protein
MESEIYGAEKGVQRVSGDPVKTALGIYEQDLLVRIH